MGTVTVNAWQLTGIALLALWCGLHIGYLLTDGRKEQKYQGLKNKIIGNAVAAKKQFEEYEQKEDETGTICWGLMWKCHEWIINDTDLKDEFLQWEKDYDEWEKRRNGEI